MKRCSTAKTRRGTYLRPARTWTIGQPSLSLFSSDNEKRRRRTIFDVAVPWRNPLWSAGYRKRVESTPKEKDLGNKKLFIYLINFFKRTDLLVERLFEGRDSRFEDVDSCSADSVCNR